MSVMVDAICSRNRYTNDPQPVIDELRELTGDRVDILTESVGTWVGFFEDEQTQTLCTGLRALPGLEPWIVLGQSRRGRGHSTQGFERPPGVTS